MTFGPLDELARRPDAPVLVVHVPEEFDDEGQVAAARERYGSMVVLPLKGDSGATDALKGRDVVLWPWKARPGRRAALEPFEAALSRTAKRLRVIVTQDAADWLGPADLNGHDPVGWARQHARPVTIETPPDDAPAQSLVDAWGLEDREPRVSDYVPADDPIYPAREPFVFRSAAELVAKPAPTDWLLQGWFERNTLAMYFGDPSSCKTWLALSQAVHIALGVPWYGARVQQGPVFVLCGEGHRGFRRRLEGLRKHHELDYTAVPLYVSEGAANLTDPDSVGDVMSAIDGLAKAYEVAPSLVVIDTVSRNFGAADENATNDMAVFVNACDRLRAQYGATILLVHHSGHGDKTRGRGNSALRAALDAEYRFARNEFGEIETTCTKAKDFEAPDARRFLLENVPLDWPPGEDGLPVNSAAVVPVSDEDVKRARDVDSRGTSDGPATSDGRKHWLGKAQQAALDALTAEYATRRARLESSGQSGATARVSLVEWERLAALDRRRFTDARRTLEDRGMVRSDGIYAFPIAQEVLNEP